jgi:hypothetical protein
MFRAPLDENIKFPPSLLMLGVPFAMAWVRNQPLQEGVLLGRRKPLILYDKPLRRL